MFLMKENFMIMMPQGAGNLYDHYKFESKYLEGNGVQLQFQK